MSLDPGARLGPYTVTAKIGEGGMGEVYRATDSRLKRDVALKLLPAAFTQDRERLSRFEREAQVLAQLHHPNISSIFGLEEAGDVRALVMELVEGPTLAERLESGPLPIDDVLSIARQIAEALEEAHEKGIVHRDLKPANVKLARDGRVKVLDFGLAKAMDPAGGSDARSAHFSMSPTLMPGATQAGMILGTAAYMAPEQAAGGAADRRADIWAFGVVLYEMLAGRRLFDGESVPHILAAVLKDAPDFSAVPPETPRRIVELLRRCLRRKTRERLQAIGDARVVIEEVIADPGGDTDAPAPAVTPQRAGPSRLAWPAAAGATAVAVVFAFLWLGAGESGPPPRVLHASLTAPAGTAFGDTFALSPDGARIVFEAYDRRSGARALWLRSLDSGEASALESSEGGEMPFWSPDGASIGFFADGKLKRVSVRGGPPQVVCAAPTPRGGAWGADGRIVFAPAFRTGLSIVPAAGGEPQPLTTLDASRNEKSHRFPVFLPGGQRVLFLAQTAEAGASNDDSAIEALDLASGKRTRLIAANSSPLLAGGDRILFYRDGALLGVRFDPAGLSVAGEPRQLASPIAFTQNEQALASVSDEGTLIYRQGALGTSASLALLGRDGVGIASIKDRELINDFALSHDGKRLVYSMHSPGQGSTDLWIQDFARNSTSRLTFEDGNEDRPVWSPGDDFIYYSNDRHNDGAIFRRAADGTGTAEEIATTDQGIWPLSISPDGRWLAVGAVEAKSGEDIFRLDLSTKEITPLVETLSTDGQAAWSPDGALLAYVSEQSGRPEVYVQSLSGEQGTWQISSQGGARPHWRADGRELLFLQRPDRLMSVQVEPGPVPRFSAPQELFRQAIVAFDVAPDAQRLVALRPADEDVDKPLTIVSHWTRLTSD